MTVDLLIRQARVVDAQQDIIADVAISEGKIAAVGSSLTGTPREEIDAAGRVLLPGLIDPHVHFNEPGRTDWEGFATGTAALAKGGVTTFFDMPLNSSPVTTTAAAFDDKHAAMRSGAQVNGYLWGGLVPDNLDALPELAERGVIGFKAFMSNSGIDEFPHVDDFTLYRGMEIIASLGLVLAVHAENDTITAQLAAEAHAQGRNGVRDYLASRPVVAECEAIQRAITLAEATGCKLHIVHVSSAPGVEIVQRARKRGVDVSCETCPHYLALCDDDVMRIGAAAKCAPPVRSAAERDALWERVLAGDVPIIASDHSPAPSALKQGDDFFAIWGGIASCQSTLSLLLTHGYHARGMSLQQIAALSSHHTAQRFGLTDKGRIAAGMDADLTLVDVDAAYTLTADELAYRHKISPYVGHELRGIVHKTWVGGKLVYG